MPMSGRTCFMDSVSSCRVQEPSGGATRNPDSSPAMIASASPQSWIEMRLDLVRATAQLAQGQGMNCSPRDFGKSGGPLFSDQNPIGHEHFHTANRARIVSPADTPSARRLSVGHVSIQRDSAEDDGA